MRIAVVALFGQSRPRGCSPKPGCRQQRDSLEPSNSKIFSHLLHCCGITPRHITGALESGLDEIHSPKDTFINVRIKQMPRCGIQTYLAPGRKRPAFQTPPPLQRIPCTRRNRRESVSDFLIFAVLVAQLSMTAARKSRNFSSPQRIAGILFA